MNLSKFLELILAAALTLFIALYFRLSSQLEILSATNIKITSEMTYLITRIDRHELAIEKLKVEMLTIERTMSKRLYELRIECFEWIKKANKRIDRNDRTR